MRFVVCALLVLCLLAVTLASPAKKKTATNACSRDCGDEYTPVCGVKKNDSKQTKITFGNDCVMANYNCAHADDPFVFNSKGECGGNVSVLLS